MIGGDVTSEILELTIYSAIYLIWKGIKFRKQKTDPAAMNIQES